MNALGMCVHPIPGITLKHTARYISNAEGGYRIAYRHTPLSAVDSEEYCTRGSGSNTSIFPVEALVP